MNPALQKKMWSYVQWKFKKSIEISKIKIPVEANIKLPFHKLQISREELENIAAKKHSKSGRHSKEVLKNIL